MTRRAQLRIVPWTALAGFFLLAPPAAAQESAYPARPGEVVIGFEDGATAAERAAILADLGATDVTVFRRTATRHARVAAIGVEEAIRRYRGHPRVRFIEPNYIYEALVVPNDPRFAELWSLENRGQTSGEPGADIRAPLAWDLTTGSEDVLIAIIDTGIDYAHPDLAANVYINPGEIAGNGIDDDRNGYVDDVRGWDFVNRDNDPFDDDGHGTHVSGIVGAAGNNGIGVVGVNWRVRILPLKFLSASGSGTLDAALRSIEYAVAMGARAINASWGGRAPSEALDLAIRDAWQAGVVFVAAAGNSGTNNDILPMYPASYFIPNVIAVAATDPFDRLPIWSSYGNNTVHLGAPGEDILSTVPGGYARMSGTSMAAPHVTGGLGLIFARYPWIAGMDARELLLAKVDSLPSLRFRIITDGRLNVHRPMVQPDSILPAQVTDLAATDVDGRRLTLRWSATGDDGTFGFASYHEVRYSTSPIDETNFASATRVASPAPPVRPGWPEELRVTGLSFATTYYVAVVVRDDYGNASPLSNVVTVTTLDPPDIGVAQSFVSADLPAGGRITTTLTLSNSGEAELNYAIEVRGAKDAGAGRSAAVPPRAIAAPAGGGADPGPAVARGLEVRASAAPRAADAEAGDRAPVDASAGGPRYVGEHAALRPVIETRDARNVSLLAAARRVLLLHSGADVSEIRRLLSAFSDLAAVDTLDATARVPKLAELTAYDAVIVVVNVPFQNAAGVGDVLADYVDAGGVVVPTLASFLAGWEVGGRLEAGGYLPVARGSGPAGVSTLGKHIAGHPLMNGVSAVTGDLLGDIGLEPGADLVASWANGVPMVATRGRVVAVNLLVGATGFWIGDVPQLLHNAVSWSSRPFWLATDSTSGVVPRGGQVDVVVTLDASGLDGGEYDAVIAVTSDDPDENEIPIPAHLSVTGQPDIVVSGDPVGLESVRTYLEDGARTTHRLVAAVPPAGPGFIDVLAEGDYGDAGAMATVVAEGVTLGPIGNSGLACAPARARFALAPALLEALAADGAVEVEIRNGPYVGVACRPNQHTVWLEYFGVGDRQDFGPTVIGLAGERTVTIRNSGSETLNVTSVVSDDPAFSVDAGPFAIPPRASRRIDVRFSPDAARLYGGTLEIRSDDPDAPQLAIALTGEGLAPPDIAVAPAEIAGELPLGGVATRTLTIRNDGASDLEFTIRPERVPGAAGGRTALLVQDVAPWGSAANQAVLAEHGIAFDVSSVADLGSFDLTRYGKVIVAGDQPTLAYIRLALQAARIEQYVAGGGVFEFHAAGWGPAEGDAARFTLPGGMRIHVGPASLNEALDPAHPLLAGVPLPITGTLASHAYFSAVPAGAALVAADDRGRVNLVVYALGRGLVIASAQKLEYGFVNREGPGSLLRNMIPFGYERAAPWLSVSPPAGRVAAGATVDVEARFDASGLSGGEHAAALAVECNDPDERTVRVPVRLRVPGVPDMAVVGSEIAVESRQSFAILGALTRHVLPAAGPVARSGWLEVEAVGDFGLYLETATVTVEGQRVGEVGRTGADCVPAPGRFPIAAADLERVIADGVVDVEVRNTANVDPLCPLNQHRVRLTYARPVEALEFGSLFVGQCRTLEIDVENRGTDELHVDAPVIGAAEFQASPASGFHVKAGERKVVTVTFCPREAGPVEGTLVLRGNDPAEPERQVRLAGEGSSPPGLAAAPAELSEALMIGGTSERRTRIANHGGTALAFRVEVGGVAWVSAEPNEGTIPPEDELEIVVRYDAGGVPAGEHGTGLLIRDIGSGEARLAIPIRLVVADVAAWMDLEPGTIHLDRRGAALRCHLQLAGSADPATIDVASLRLNHTVPAKSSPIAIGDHDGDGTQDLMVTFDIDAARATLGTGEAVRAIVTGRVGASGRLLGSTVARVMGLRPLAASGGPVAEGSAAITAGAGGDDPVFEPMLHAAPSPFTPANGTGIRFALTAAGMVELGVFNIAGARVRMLANGWHLSGRREVRWDGRDGAGSPLGPGLYFLRLKAPGVTLTRRIVLVK